MEETIRIQYYQSPCGKLIIGSYGDKLCLCDWQDEERRKLIDARLQKDLHAGYEEGGSVTIEEAITQLDEYFDHKRTFSISPCFLPEPIFRRRYGMNYWRSLMERPSRTPDFPNA